MEEKPADFGDVTDPPSPEVEAVLERFANETEGEHVTAAVFVLPASRRTFSGCIVLLFLHQQPTKWLQLTQSVWMRGVDLFPCRDG